VGLDVCGFRVLGLLVFCGVSCLGYVWCLVVWVFLLLVLVGCSLLYTACVLWGCLTPFMKFFLSKKLL
jgi:hypothetical protein